MTDDKRYTAVGKQYVPCDSFGQFTESDFGRFIEGFIYTVDKDGIITINARDGKVQIRPYQYLFIYDGDRVFVKDKEGYDGE